MAKGRRHLTQAQIADYDRLCHDRTYGRILTPDGLRFICEANNYNAEDIGKHFLDVLSRICPDHSMSKHLSESEPAVSKEKNGD